MPSRCQGEAAKTTEAGARARDHHDELFFGPKKALVKQISRFPAGLPRLCSCGPVLGPFSLASMLSLCMQRG
jgi:hypothetical protein